MSTKEIDETKLTYTVAEINGKKIFVTLGWIEDEPDRRSNSS